MHAKLSAGNYRLNKALLGIINDGERVPITVPADAEVRVLANHDATPLVDVRWGDREFVMFAADLSRYAEQMGDSADA